MSDPIKHEARMGELRAVMRGLVVLLAMSAIQGLVALGLVMWAGGGL